MNFSHKLLILVTAWLLPLGVFAADQVDSQMHSDVSRKVQSDHEQDMKAGKISRHSSRAPASAQAGAITSPATGGTSGTQVHPAQVQQLQKKQATPPPKVTKPTTGGAH